MIDIENYMHKFTQSRIKRGLCKNVKYIDGILYYEDMETSGLGVLTAIYDTLTGRILKRKKVDDIEQY